MTTAEILQLLREGSEFRMTMGEALDVRNSLHKDNTLTTVYKEIFAGARHRDSRLQPILAKAIAALELALEQRNSYIMDIYEPLEHANKVVVEDNQAIVDLVKGMK